MILPAELPSPINMTRQQIVDLLLYEEYGKLPSLPTSVEAVETHSVDKRLCPDGTPLLKITLKCKAEFGEFSFPVYYACPLSAKKPVPAFIHINFRDSIPDKYQPTEEILDAGYATLTFCYKDVSGDDDDFTSGLAGVVYKDGQRGARDCGKIGLWAWAAIAVMNYAQTLDEIDHERISVIGHSRLGKTALLAGALDERFFCAISNDSGCCGAALSRNKTGETVKDICETFPFWFCESYFQYADNEDALPFDQHFLIAANSSHLVYVASAIEDKWACPDNEYLCCVAASEYFISQGKSGFIHPDRLPNVGESLHDGSIGYHLRDGHHFLSRRDWSEYIAFLKKHNG